MPFTKKTSKAAAKKRWDAANHAKNVRKEASRIAVHMKKRKKNRIEKQAKIRDHMAQLTELRYLKKMYKLNYDIKASEESDSVSPLIVSHRNTTAVIRDSDTSTSTETETETESDKLMQKSNTYTNVTLAKMQYYRNKDGKRIRLGLDCPYIGCNEPLQLLNGIHGQCLGTKQMIRCNHCKHIISGNVNLFYYHCIDGCLQYKSVESHQYYLCIKCAETHCYSPQKYVSSDCTQLAFCGVWTAFDRNNKCQIMTILQDSNRISLHRYQSGNAVYGTIQAMNDDESTEILIAMDGDEMTDYKHGIWKCYNESHVTLQLMKANKNNITYHKVMPKCIHCQCVMAFFYKKIFPNKRNSENIKCCDNFEEYNYMKYSTLEAINYGIFHDNIHKNEFYFYCTQCNDYSLCGGCSLVRHEIQINEQRNGKLAKNENGNKLLNNQLMVERKRWKELMEINNTIQTERDYWRQKHESLYNSMQTVLNHNDSM